MAFCSGYPVRQIRSFDLPGLPVTRFYYSSKIPRKMRKTVLIIAILAVTTTLFTSCASYRSSSKYGCKSTQGYVGYGATR